VALLKADSGNALICRDEDERFSPPAGRLDVEGQGYPHDTGGVRKKNSSFLYNVTRTIYEREGFTYDRPKGLGNCVMVREVAPSTSD
jgi:hypothetical protein